MHLDREHWARRTCEDTRKYAFPKTRFRPISLCCSHHNKICVPLSRDPDEGRSRLFNLKVILKGMVRRHNFLNVAVDGLPQSLVILLLSISAVSYAAVRAVPPARRRSCWRGFESARNCSPGGRQFSIVKSALQAPHSQITFCRKTSLSAASSNTSSTA